MVVCIISVEREGSLGTVVGGRFGLYLDHLFISYWSKTLRFKCSFQPTAVLERHDAPEKY